MFLLSQWNALCLGLGAAFTLLCQRQGKTEKTTASKGLTCISSHIKYTNLPKLKSGAATLNENLK